MSQKLCDCPFVTQPCQVCPRTLGPEDLQGTRVLNYTCIGDAITVHGTILKNTASLDENSKERVKYFDWTTSCGESRVAGYVGHRESREQDATATLSRLIPTSRSLGFLRPGHLRNRLVPAQCLGFSESSKCVVW